MSIEYLNTWSYKINKHYLKHTKHLLQNAAYYSHVGWKRFGVLWSTNEKVIDSKYLHPNWLFSGDYISALSGCYALKFLHALEIHRCLLAHTPSGAGVPLQKISWKFKSWPKIQLVTVNNFRSGSILRKHFQATCREAGVITCVQFLESPPPKICYGK